MKRHVMSARVRYGQYLDEQKKESLNEQQRKKQKGVQLSIREAERKKSKVDTSIVILGKEAGPAVTRNPQAGERTQRPKGKAQEIGVNSIIYSVALPFICEIKQKLNK